MAGTGEGRGTGGAIRFRLINLVRGAIGMQDERPDPVAVIGPERQRALAFQHRHSQDRAALAKLLPVTDLEILNRGIISSALCMPRPSRFSIQS